jgi:predicted HAD superfamily Cof-like phosphohydrolase
MNFLRQVYNFNRDADLLNGYSDERECAFPIEEALEGFDDLTTLAAILQLDDPLASPKTLSRKIISLASTDDMSLSDVDRLDKHIDIIIFSLGSIFKLGLNPEQTMEAISVVATANMQKLHMPKDSHGKLTKPAGFTPPEEQLQLLLDYARSTRARAKGILDHWLLSCPSDFESYSYENLVEALVIDLDKGIYDIICRVANTTFDTLQEYRDAGSKYYPLFRSYPQFN